MYSLIDKMKMDRVQTAQFGFVLFTLVQVLIFIYFPVIYNEPMKEVDGPPYYGSLRLIGTKEIGLMTIYSSGVYTNDRTIAWLTVIGRASTILVLPFFVFFVGAPVSVLGGIIQDVIGSAITGYLLVSDKPTKRNPRLNLPDSVSLLPRMIILAAGIWELHYAYRLMSNPSSVRLLPEPIFGAPLRIHIRLFGYMTGLIALYQLYIGLVEGRDGITYLAVAFHHLNFYCVSKYYLSWLMDKAVTVPFEHFVFGVGIAAMTLSNAAFHHLRGQDKAKAN